MNKFNKLLFKYMPTDHVLKYILQQILNNDLELIIVLRLRKLHSPHNEEML